MRSSFTPGTAAMLCLLAAGSTAPAADAPARGAAAVIPDASAIQVGMVDFSSGYHDPYSQSDWMVARVDFTAKSNPDPAALNPKWVDNVTINLTLAWGKGSTLDMAMTSTLKVTSIEIGKKNSVFFFVPPEILMRGLTKNGSPIAARQTPPFYAVQISAGGTPIPPGPANVSSSIPNATRDLEPFLELAADKTSATTGLLMTEATAPAYVLIGVLSTHAQGTNVPSYFSGADAGH